MILFFLIFNLVKLEFDNDLFHVVESIHSKFKALQEILI